MNNTLELKGVAKAAREFNNWEGCARIFLDVSDGEVWTNIYGSGNDFSKYHSNDIYEVYNKTSMMEQWNKISNEELENICHDYIDEDSKKTKKYNKLFLNIQIEQVPSKEYSKRIHNYKLSSKTIGIAEINQKESEQVIFEEIPLLGLFTFNGDFSRFRYDLSHHIEYLLEEYITTVKECNLFFKPINKKTIPYQILKELFKDIKEDLEKSLEKPSSFDVNFILNTKTGNIKIEVIRNH